VESRIPWFAIAVALILGFAFSWNQVVGARGFFALDQGILMDGAWRIQQGQVPFVDFLAPTGLVPMYLVSGFFDLFGAGFDNYLIFGSLINVVGAMLVMAIVRILFRERRSWTLIAGSISAICFQAPMGTPYADQFAYLFVLLGLWLFLASCQHAGAIARILEALCGASWLLALLSKQSMATFSFVVLLVLIWYFGRGWKQWLLSLGVMGVGFAIGCAVFLLWLFQVSDPAAFWDSTFGIPSEEGRRRIAELAWNPIRLFHYPERGPFVVYHVISLIVFGVGLVQGFRAKDRELFGLGLLGLSYSVFHVILAHVSHNGPSGLRALLPILFLVFLDVGRRLLEGIRSPGRIRIAAVVGTLVLSSVLLIRFVESAWSRKLNEPVVGADFSRKLDWPGWRTLRWGDPTEIFGKEYRLDDLQALMRILQQKDVPFFAWPESTFLYCALGKPSPQPLLWFHPGLTYRRSDASLIERRILDSLESQGVKIVVVEEDYLASGVHVMEDFPDLCDWITSKFKYVRRFGPWLLYERP